MKTLIIALVIALSPLAASARTAPTHTENLATTSIAIAAGPGNVGSTASEMATFVLAVASLVVSGFALSRTKNR